MKYIIYKEKLDIFQPTHPEGGPGNAMQTNNPDFDDLYPEVDSWVLEVDDDTNRTNREIGIDKEKEPIVLAPWGCNYGLWVDSVVSMKQIEYTETTEEEFEKLWMRLKDNLER